MREQPRDSPASPLAAETEKQAPSPVKLESRPTETVSHTHPLQTDLDTIYFCQRRWCNIWASGIPPKIKGPLIALRGRPGNGPKSTWCEGDLILNMVE